MKHYAVMCFSTEMELGLSNKPEVWVNTKNFLYTNPLEALYAYSDIPCPASQLIDADSEEELKQKMEEMKTNFTSKDWLNEHLYPYL